MRRRNETPLDKWLTQQGMKEVLDFDGFIVYGAIDVTSWYDHEWEWVGLWWHSPIGPFGFEVLVEFPHRPTKHGWEYDTSWLPTAEDEALVDAGNRLFDREVDNYEPPEPCYDDGPWASEGPERQDWIQRNLK